VCNRPLQELSRIPVCRECLREPEPLIAEHFCTSCRTPFLNHYPLDENGQCPMCRLGLRGFDAAYAFGAYEGTLRKLIHLFKYSRIAPLAQPLGRMMAGALPRDERYDAIVPLPLHWLRRWGRGFNQSKLLAEELARRSGVPVLEPVRRKRATSSQAGLSNSARRTNVRGAFEIKKPNQVAGRRILLVDDVMTTGATASACGQALKNAGAKYVALLALARVDRRYTAVSMEQQVGGRNSKARGAG
jgi:ComF family protein